MHIDTRNTTNLEGPYPTQHAADLQLLRLLVSSEVKKSKILSAHTEVQMETAKSEARMAEINSDAQVCEEEPYCTTYILPAPDLRRLQLLAWRERKTGWSSA